MIKLVFGKKNKIIKLQPPTYDHLRKIIRETFSDAPPDYCLSYLDAEKDEICLTSDEDMQIMMSGGLKVTKVFIKQSITQTLVIEPEFTEQISVDFEEKKLITEEDKKKVQGEVVLNMAKKQQQEEGETVEVSKQEEQKKEEPKQIDIGEISQIRKSSEELKKDIPEDSLVHKPLLSSPSSSSLKSEGSERQAKEAVVAEVEQPEAVKPEKVEENQQEKEKPKDESKVVAPKPLQVQKEYRDIAVNSQIPSPQKEVIIPLYIPKEQLEPKPKPDNSEKYSVAKSEWADLVDEKVEQIKPQKAPAELGNPLSPDKVLVQHEAICSVCRADYGILGARYQCIFCESFNLCSSCEANTEHPHALLKVKHPSKAVSRQQLIKIFGNQGPKVPEGVVPIPPTHYVPSISKDDALGYMKEAQKSLEEGYERGKRLLNDMFLKLELNHRNPYDNVQPLKVESNEQKANNLSNMFGINYREALQFVKRFPNKTSEQVVQIYIDHENKKKAVNYPMNPYEHNPRRHYNY